MAVDSDDVRLLNIALREIGRLNDLVSDFLAFARPRPPLLHPIDLSRDIFSLAEAIQLLWCEATETPRLNPTACPTDDVWILADRDQLQAILWNLVRNAWEAGEKSLIDIRV
jgi:two-component system sensor histidine kinase PilS (NtrC family)